MKQAGVTITYAGVDITQWMYVQMVKRDVGTNHVNTMQKVGISDGQMLQYMSRDVKTVVVTGIVMNDDLVPLRRSLAAAIDADEPQQLIFGDEPDKYYLAIVDSQPTFTEGFRSGTISISFVCPDGGIAHSVVTQTADNTPYKDASNLLLEDPVGTQVATGGNWLFTTIGYFNGKPGKQYTASVNIEQLDNAISFEAWTSDINGIRQEKISAVVFSATGKASITFVAPNTGDYSAIILQLAWINGDVSGSYSWSETKAELGDTATPYEASPLNMMTGTAASKSYYGTDYAVNPIAYVKAPIPGARYSFAVNSENSDHVISIEAWAVDAAGKRKLRLDSNTIGPNSRGSISFMWPLSGVDGAVKIEIDAAWTNGTDSGTYILSHEKLEIGTTASPWSPNPADPEYYADTITVHNGGTYPVEPVITATMHADNGLIALINSQGGVLQFGNPEEADGVERKRSEVARYEGFDKEPVGVAYNTGQTNSHYYYIAAQKNVMEGSVKYADDDGSAAEPVFLPTNSYYWEGPSLHLNTTNASNGSNTGSFIAKWRYKFNSNVSALGAIEMTLDNDTGVAYEVIIRANYAGKDDVDVQVFVGSTLVFQQTLNRRVFSNGRYYEAKLTKLGNTLNLQLAGIVQGGITPSEVITRNPPLVMPPIALTPAQASIPITGTTLWFQRFENYPYPDMGVYDMDVEWLNVDYWTDLKNRFGAGDVVTIDVANRAVYVNGVPDTTLHTIGNEWSKFRFNPGDTLIQMVPSSWAQPFACEVDLREAWL
ncbi:distal tail protein Dit [Lacticaseibacillus paracasei]